jgi:hypothetical protein
MKPIIIPSLEPYLIGKDAILHLPKVLERIGTQKAFNLLLDSYLQLSVDLRDKALEAMLHLHRELKQFAYAQHADGHCYS